MNICPSGHRCETTMRSIYVSRQALIFLYVVRCMVLPSFAFSGGHGSRGNNGGPLNEILYRRNVFSKEELTMIQFDVNSYLGKLKPESTSSVAHGRRGVSLPAESPTVAAFREGSLINWICRVVGSNLLRLRQEEVPIEVRSYEQTGAGMAWHSDDVLFSPQPQLEVVYTLENTSDCQTLFKTSNGQIENVQTEVNSALLVPAGGPEHCVTSLQRGRRIILKAVYAPEECQYLEAARVQQFKGSKPKKGRRR